MEHTKVDAFLQLQSPFIWNKPDLVWREKTDSVFCWMLPLRGERWLFSVYEPLQVSIRLLSGQNNHVLEILILIAAFKKSFLSTLLHSFIISQILLSVYLLSKKCTHTHKPSKKTIIPMPGNSNISANILFLVLNFKVYIFTTNMPRFKRSHLLCTLHYPARL